MSALPLMLLFLSAVALTFQSCKGKSKSNNLSAATDSLSDDALMDTVQRRTFLYFWEGAEPNSGLAPERYHVDGVYPENDANVVTSGGSGFGIMAILAGIDRGYVTREEGLARMERIVSFLEKADRFHGAYPHWWYGDTGKVKPFGQKDNGGDLVETAFLIQGLLAVHQYYVNGNEKEKALAQRIDQIWRDVDWNWYRQGGQNVLYWHWSPTYGWEMNFPVHGYNECMIMYILAAASPTHGVPAAVYHDGWAQNGAIVSPHKVEGIELHLRYQGTEAGPLFWAQYSFLGLDPVGLKDEYCPSYFHEMRNLTLVNRAYCIRNPKHYKGFGPDCWGLTASYSVDGYAAHSPNEQEDKGVISPTAALSSIIYTPEDIGKEIEKFADYDLVLVDTAGFSHKNDGQREDMKRLLKNLPAQYERQIYLVLSATTKYKDLIEITDIYDEFCDFHLIFTKLDETSAYGNILNIKLHTGAQLSYVTTGQNVPDDIEVVDTQKLVKLLLGGR